MRSKGAVKDEMGLTERLSVLLDAELLKRLERAATANERTVSQETRLALRRHLASIDGEAGAQGAT